VGAFLYLHESGFTSMFIGDCAVSAKHTFLDQWKIIQIFTDILISLVVGGMPLAIAQEGVKGAILSVFFAFAL